MAMLLQKGGDFMTIMRNPFKKKRTTIVGDGKRSPSSTPRSARASSTARSNSVGSSVNSYEESEVVVETNFNASTKNIYADIDDDKCDVSTNQTALCDQKPPELPAANHIGRFKVLQVSTINECEQFEECVEVTEDDLLSVAGIEHKLNCSKNNLLLIDDQLMTTSMSIDNHLNNIELINRNLDRLMETHEMIDNDDQDDSTPPELKAEKKKLKAKIAAKIKVLKEARMMSPSTSEATTKESFKSRVKNIFPKFEKQSSQDDDEKPKEKIKIGKGFLSSFKKKSSIADETDEDFEEIKKVPSDGQMCVTDLDEIAKVDGTKGEKISFKHKLKLNLKTTKELIASKMHKKSSPSGNRICHRCSKKFSISVTGTRVHPSKAVWDFNKEFHTEALFDNEFCVCVDVDELDDDDGICIKNFEYKDVSFAFLVLFLHGTFKH